MTESTENCNTESSNKIFINSATDSNKTSSNKNKDISVKQESKFSNINSKNPNIELSSCNTESVNETCESADINYDSDSDCNNDYNSIDSANSKLDLCIHNGRRKDGIVLNERKLVNKMISNYYNPKSVSIEDNRDVLKRLLPIFNNLISSCFTFVEKVNKIRHNLNPTKSSKTFRLIYESYRSLFFNLHKSFSAILDVKYRGNDVLEYTINNIESVHNNKIYYASCNNFYETNSTLDKSTLFYSVPGITILINHTTLSYRIIAKKSNSTSKSKIYKYDFLLIPGSGTSCNKVSKSSFIKVLDSIIDFRNDKYNNLLEFINFLQHESKSIKCVI